MDEPVMTVGGKIKDVGKRLVALVLCCTVTWTSVPAWAQVAAVANASGQTPGQQVAANGVPVVDIVAPNAKGVSHNKFERFDVGSNGLILNNSASISKTQLGGYIAGNDNLSGSGPASLILNEVSSTASRLNGYLEIAGSKAQLVIANPNGISCDGCGFINTSRVTLATGTPQLDGAGGLASFVLGNGALQIGSNGLDASEVDRLDLLSRQLAVGGSVWARDLLAAAGNGRIGLDGMMLEVLRAGDAPAFGIDVAYLGGMYANRIRLIATEAGVGVVSQGTLAAQSGELRIDSNGQVSLGGTAVARDALTVQAAGALAQSGVSGSQAGDVSLRAASATLTGDLIAAGTLQAATDGVLAHSGRSSAAAIGWSGGELAVDGSVYSAGTLALDARGELRSTGTLYAGGAAALSAERLALSGLLQSGAGIGLRADAIEALGTLDAATALGIHSTGSLRLDGWAQGRGAVDVSAGSLLDTAGVLVAGGALRLQAAALDNREDAVISAGGALDANLGTTTNAGTIYTGSGLSLQGADLDNRGALYAGGAATLALGESLRNRGSLVAGDALRVQAAQLASSGDLGSQRAGVALSADALALSGNTVAADALAIQAGRQAQVAGAVSASRVQVDGAGDIALGGSVQASAGALQVRADGTLDSRATLQSSGAMELRAGRALNLQGQAQSLGAMALQGATIDSQGVLDARRSLSAIAAQDMQLAGTVQAQEALSLQAQGTLDNHAVVIAGGALSVDAADLRNTQEAALSAAGDARLQVAGVLDNAGSVYAGGDLAIASSTFQQQGSSSAGGDLAVRVDRTLENAGSLVAHGALQVQAGTLRSQGQLGSEAGAVTLASAGALDLDGVVAAAESLRAEAGGDLRQAGNLQAGTLALRSGGDLQLDGRVQSGAALDLQAQRALTLAGQARSGGAAALQAAQVATTAQAVLQSVGELTLESRTFEHLGTFDAGGALRLQATEGVVSAGTLQAGTDLELRTDGTLQSSGLLIAGRDLRLQAAAIDNAAGGVLAAQQDLTANVAGALDNAGSLQAVGELRLQAGALTQSEAAESSAGGALTATVAGDVDNRGRLIAGGALGVSAASLSSRGQLGSREAGIEVTTAHDLALDGLVSAASAATLRAGGALHQAGVLQAGQARLDAGTMLQVDGSLQSAGTLALSAAGALSFGGQAQAGGAATLAAGNRLEVGDAAVLQSAGDLELNAAALDSRGTLDAGRDLRLSAGGDVALAGLVQAGRDAAIQAGQQLDNRAQVVAGRDLQVRGANLDNAGILAAQRDLRLQADTALDNGGALQAGGALDLQARTLRQHGSVYGGDAIAITSAGAFDNQGSLVAGNGLSIQAASLSSVGQLGALAGEVRLEAAQDIALDGTLVSPGALTVSAGGDLSQRGALQAAQGRLQAGRDLSLAGSARVTGALELQAQRALALDAQARIDGGARLDGAQIALSQASTVQTGGALQLQAETLDSAGELVAGGDLALQADTLALAGAVQSAGTLQLQAQALLDNRAEVVAGQRLELRAGAVRNAGEATLAALGTLQATVEGTLDNAGTLQSGGDLQLQAGALQQTGRTQAGGTLQARIAGTLDNQGALVATGALDARAGQLLSSGDLGSQQDAVVLAADQALSLTGKSVAAGALQATAGGDLGLAGTVQAQALALQAGQDLSLDGSVQSRTGLQAQAQRRLSLQGQLVAGGDLALDAAQIATAATAQAEAGGDLAVQAGRIDSRATLVTGGDLRLRSTDGLALAGVVQAARDVTLQADGALDSAAQVYAARNLTLGATQVSVAADGTLGAQQAMSLATAGAFEQAGQLAAGGTLALQAGSLQNTGSLQAGQSLTLDVAGLADSAGSLVARDGVSLKAGALSSRGQLGSERGDVRLDVRGDATLAGTVAAMGALQIEAGGDLQQQGSLSAQSLTVQAGRDAVLAGAVHGAQSADLQAQRLLRVDGQLGAASANLSAGGTLASGENAVVQSSGALTLRGGAIDSRGILDAGTTLSLHSDGDTTLAGTVQSDGTVTLDAGGALNNRASVLAGSDLQVQAAGLDNRGVLLAQRDLTLASTGLAANAGGLRAGRSLGLDVGSLSQSGQAYGVQALGLTARGAVDNQGDLIGGGALNVSAARIASSGQLGSERGAVTLTSQGDLRLAGTLASSGAFTAQAGGTLNQSGTLNAATTLALTAGSDLNVTGQLSAARIDLDAGATLSQQGSVRGDQVSLHGARIDNAGQSVASQRLELRGGDIAIAGTVAAGIAADGSLGQGGTLALVADRSLQASGQLLAGGSLSAQGASLTLAGSTTRVSGDTTLTSAGAIDHRGGDLLSGGTLTLQARGTLDNGTDANGRGGSLQANQLTVNAGALGNAGGRLVQTGGGATRLVFDGAIDNRGGTLASNGSDLTLSASSLDNRQGRIQHAGSGTLALTSRGAFANAGGQVLTQGGLTLTASGTLDNQNGALAAAGDASVSAASLLNGGGSIAARALGLTLASGVDNRNGLLQASGGTLGLRADSLANAGGTVQAVAANGSGGTLQLELGHGLDNGNGTLAASGNASVSAENIANAGGLLQAGNALSVTARGQFDNHQDGRLSAGGALNLAVTGALLNSGGQLDAGTILTASGGRIDNRQGRIVNNGTGQTRLTTGGTLDNAGGNLGGRGDVVLDAAGIGNGGGQLVAGGELTANTNALDNQGGNVYAGGGFWLQRSGATLDNRNGTLKAERAVHLDLQSLSNSGGQIAAGSTTGGAGDVVIATTGFDGGGSILAQNLLDLTLHGDYTHRAGTDLTSNGDFVLRVGGNLANEATLKAARTLDISAASIANRSGASILANDTRLSTGGLLDNDGSLSGNGALTLRAGSLDNTGSIVGGNVLVDTGSLVNGADLGSATDNSAYGSALLASTGDMTLLVRDQLLNRDARIFSLGNLAIGGARDGGGTLSARTGTVTNLSGSIEADGNLLIAANQINNQRRTLTTATGPLTAAEQAEANASLPAEELIKAGTIQGANGASAQRPYTGHAPGTWRSYSAIQRDRLIAASAEGRIAAGGSIGLSGSVTNNASTIAAAGALLVNQHGVSGLSDGMLTGNENVLNQALALRQVIQQTDTEYTVRAVTNDCPQPAGKRMICYYEDDSQVVATSTTDSSYTALAANMTGGQGVAISGATISNGAVGLDGRSVSGASMSGTGQASAPSRRSVAQAGSSATQAVQGRAQAQGSATRIANGLQGRSAAAVATAQGQGVAGAGGLERARIDDGSVPSASLQTDAIERRTLAADVGQSTLAGTGQAERSSVEVGTSTATLQRTRAVQRNAVDIGGNTAQVVGGVGTPLSTLDLPLGGLYRLVGTPATDASALGRAASGLGAVSANRSGGPNRRYLIETDPRFVDYDNFVSSDYLLDKLNVDPEGDMKRLGDGFYEQRLVLDQITSLTGRRYLGDYADGVAQYRALLEAGVAQAGTLNLSVGVALTAEQVAALTQDMVWLVEQDYQGQKVLVPVVYLASSSLTLRRDGALIAGGSVELNASGALVNQGTVSGSDVAMTAGNLLNQGRIAGTGTVALQARQDLLNQGGQISGRDVALSAGNALGSLSVAGLGAQSTVAGISAGHNLALLSGGDMTLSGTTVSAGGNALLAAGGSLLAQPGALRQDGGLVRGGEATTIDAGGDLQLSAGNDLQLHGVTVSAAGSAALQAGHDLSLTPSASGSRTSLTTGDSLQLAAGNDLTIRQAEVSAGGDLLAAAGHDLNVTSILGASTTQTDNTRQGKTRVTTTTTTQALDQQVLSAGGNLVLSAGHDVNLTAARLDAGQGLAVAAGNDLNSTTLTTTDTRSTLETRKRFKQLTQTSDETVHGSEFSAGSDIALQAGQDVNLTAATVSSENGGIALAAGHDVNLLSAQEQHDAVQDMQKKKKGLLSSKTTTTHDEWHDSTAVGTTLSGETVQVAATNNLLAQGAQIAGTGDVVLAAGNDLTLEASENTHSEEHDKKVKKSGLFGNGGLSVTLGSRKVDTEADITATTHTGSTAGSLEGDVVLAAGNALTVKGSNVTALQGDIAMRGQSVDIEEVHDESTYQSVQTFKQSGLSVGASVPIIDAAMTAYDSARTVGESKDDRINALAAANAAYDTYQAAGAAASAASGGQAASFSITYGSQKSRNEAVTQSSQAVGSAIRAAGQLDIEASGAGAASDIRVSGSEVYGGMTTRLSAEDAIDIVAAQDTQDQHSKNTSSGWNVGVAVTASSSGWAAGITAGVNGGKGSGNGESVTQVNSHVGSGGITLLSSGGTTTLSGGQVAGERVEVDAANLVIQSLQDTETYKSQQKNASVQVTVGYGASVSGSYSQSKINANYASVGEQSGILAGDGGYAVKVAGNTDLKGGIVTSSEAAEADGRNSFSTGTLSAEDIQNHADYKGSAFGISGSAGVNGKGQQGEHALAQGSADGKAGGTAASKSMGFGYDSGHQSGITESGINTANLTITDAVGQAATGKSVEQVKVDVATQTSTDSVQQNSGAIANTFDANAMQKELDVQVSVTQAFDQNRQEAKAELYGRAQAKADEAHAIRMANGGVDTDESKRLDEEAAGIKKNAMWLDIAAMGVYAGPDVGNLLTGETLTQVDLVRRTATAQNKIVIQKCEASGQNCSQREVDVKDVAVSDGNIYVFNNGIFNAEEYALATGAKQNTDTANAQGVYYILNPYTGNPVAEMLYAGYDKLNDLVGAALPLTSAEKANQTIIDIAGKEGGLVNSVNHSRGGMTWTNAIQSLHDQSLSDQGVKILAIGSVLYNGAAANAQEMADLLDGLSGSARVYQSTHPTDIVGRWLGGNAATAEKNDGSFPGSHSSYTGYLPPVGTLIQVGSDSDKIVNLRDVTDKNWGSGNYSVPVYVPPTKKEGRANGSE